VCDLSDFLQNIGEACLPVEDNDRSFGIAPTQVRKKLVNGVEELLLASPELALCDKDISAVSRD
jgi:hypothetical protein